jgi:signal transduction histidine kinase
MFSSLRSRLWLSYALLVVMALSVVAIVLFIYLLRNPLLYRQTSERLQAVQAVVMERGSAPQSQSISDAAQNASATFKVRVLLYSQDKQLILDTYSSKKVPLPFPQNRLILRNNPIVRDGKGEAWLYSIDQLPDSTYLVVASPRPRVSILNIFVNDFLPLFLQTGLIALLLSLVIAFFFARWIADPLQKVVVAARAMPSAEIKPIEPQGPHEVQDLTRAFNSMILRTRASQQSQRDFVANVSHELKTPLTSVQGFAQAILDGTADSVEARQQAAQVIFDESGRMHRMVLDLLDLARLDAGTADITMLPVNVSALLNAIQEKFLPQSQKASVEVKVETPPNLPSLTADGDRLAQVFTNLVDNALKFTPRGGVIFLNASVVNGEMLISVSDTGVGIPVEAQAHIFERFYQADSSRRGGAKHGAGLGLAIAHDIVRAHGGKISVRSSLGKGTSFDVFLPLTGKSATTIVRRK